MSCYKSILLAAYNCNAPEFTPSAYISDHNERISVTYATLGGLSSCARLHRLLRMNPSDKRLEHHEIKSSTGILMSLKSF
jgi:hypothetical protein